MSKPNRKNQGTPSVQQMRELRAKYREALRRAAALACRRDLSVPMRTQLREIQSGLAGLEHLLTPMPGHRAYLGKRKVRP